MRLAQKANRQLAFSASPTAQAGFPAGLPAVCTVEETDNDWQRFRWDFRPGATAPVTRWSFFQPNSPAMACITRHLGVGEPMTGFEPVTSSLPRKCSTTELHWQICRPADTGSVSESGRRGSNPRPSAWKTDALSTELLPHCLSWPQAEAMRKQVIVGADGFEPPKAKPADLQSAPFGHSGTRPIAKFQ